MKAAAGRPDHYATLGVDPGASAADIRAAYLKLLREHHPDRNHGPEAVDRTKAIIAAFKVLGDFDQRSYYDWDRRRDREAAQAAAMPRRRSRAGLAAGAIGIAAVCAWLLLPNTDPAPPASAPPTATVEAEQDAAPPARTSAVRPRLEQREPVQTVVRTEPELAEMTVDMPVERVAKSEPPKPVERVASLRTSPSQPQRVTEPTAPIPVRVAAKAAPPTRGAPARSATDIAQLDQFVMSFYGQSWRFGDAPKRAVLEKTKAGFVARRGACGGDSCRRDAYLDLMRDVSSIVETGKPETR